MDKRIKLCVIYNGAPHYRAGIFRMIDEEYDCEWFIAQGYGNIKQLPLSFFRKATPQKMVFLKGGFTYQKGQVLKMLSKKYDMFLIMGNVPNISTWLGLILHNLFNHKRKVYMWTHGMLRIRGLRTKFDKVFFRLPYGVFTYGDRAREIMISQGLNKDRIFAIHNSLDYSKQIIYRGNFTDIYKRHFNNNWPTLIFIGRLTPIKKLDLLVTATSILKKEGHDVNLVFVGEGSVKNGLQEQVKKLGIIDRTWFYGSCYDEKEKSELLSNADICVAPGNIGLTAMDSLVYGTPAITMDNFDMQMPEFEAIKENFTGGFFKEDSAQDLSNKIYEWLISNNRDETRQNCYKMIDTLWTPEFQMSVLRKHLLP